MGWEGSYEGLKEQGLDACGSTHVKAAVQETSLTTPGMGVSLRAPTSPSAQAQATPSFLKVGPLIPVYSTHPRSIAFWAGGRRAKASLCDPGQVTPLPLPQARDLPTTQDQGHTGRFATGRPT